MQTPPIHADTSPTHRLLPYMQTPPPHTSRLLPYMHTHKQTPPIHVDSSPTHRFLPHTDSAGVAYSERLQERWWRHSCFTIGQIHHMTTMTCFSNIFKSKTTHKFYFTWKISHPLIALTVSFCAAPLQVEHTYGLLPFRHLPHTDSSHIWSPHTDSSYIWATPIHPTCGLLPNRPLPHTDFSHIWTPTHRLLPHIGPSHRQTPPIHPTYGLLPYTQTPPTYKRLLPHTQTPPTHPTYGLLLYTQTPPTYRLLPYKDSSHTSHIWASPVYTGPFHTDSSHTHTPPTYTPLPHTGPLPRSHPARHTEAQRLQQVSDGQQTVESEDLAGAGVQATLGHHT